MCEGNRTDHCCCVYLAESGLIGLIVEAVGGAGNWLLLPFLGLANLTSCEVFQSSSKHLQKPVCSTEAVRLVTCVFSQPCSCLTDRSVHLLKADVPSVSRRALSHCEAVAVEQICQPLFPGHRTAATLKHIQGVNHLKSPTLQTFKIRPAALFWIARHRFVPQVNRRLISECFGLVDMCDLGLSSS